MSETEDKPLDPWMRAALLSEGLDGGPSDEQRQRMAGKLAAAIGVSAAALLGKTIGGGGGPGGAGSSGGAGGAAGMIASSKQIAALLGALAVGGAVGVTVSELRSREREQPIVRAEPPDTQVATAPDVPVDALPIDAPGIDAALIDAGTPSVRRRDAGIRSSADARVAMTPDELAREREIIDVARAALRRGDLRLAAKNLIEHSMRFPAGALVEEERVLSIELALAQGKRADAEQRAAAFRRDFPRSVFSNRVDELMR